MTIKLPILVTFSLALVACTLPPSANNTLPSSANNTNMQAPANEGTMEQTIAVTNKKSAIFNTTASTSTAPNTASETNSTEGKIGIIMDASVTSNNNKVSSVVSESGINATPQPLGFEDKTDTERLAGARGDSRLIIEKKDSTVKKGQFSFPQYRKAVLANGMTVYLLEKHDIPVITVKAIIKAGSVNDPISGLASMTAEGLLLGTKKYNKVQLEQVTDNIGAGFDAGSNKESSYINADFLTKDADVMFDVIRSVLTEPTFNAKEFAKFQKQNVELLAQQKESPNKVIRGYYSKFVFDKHAYANPVEGDQQSIATITPKQLATFHNSYYQPVNTAITVVGDFNANVMKLELEALFADWNNTQPVPQLDLNYAVPVMDKSRVLVVNKANATETTFIFGGVGIAKDNPDYIGIQLVNTILGGRFTSWLNDELRVNSGLTYGAGSGFSAWSQSGLFSISSFTQTSTTERAVDLAIETYERLWEKGVDQETLDSAKAYLKGQFPPRYETSEQLAEVLGDMYVYGINESYINNFEKQVDSLTLDDTHSLVNQYFPNKNLQFVMIGKAAELQPFVSKYGSVEMLNIEQVGFGG